MPKNDFLEMNPRKIIRCLTGIISEDEIKKIEEEILVNTKKLIRLADSHLRFAKKSSGADAWRNRVSRAYYACYSVSKAIRLAEEGIYSTEASDHKKIGQIPDKFPNKNIWSDKLVKFRADRNIADYEHNANEGSLEYKSKEYLQDAELFVKEVKKYLKGKGLL